MCLIIAIDIDDVLADYMSSLLAFFNKVYNQKIERIDMHTYNFHEILGVSSKKLIAELGVFEKDALPQLSRVQGAYETLAALSKNHTVIAVTSRQIIHKEITMEWVNRCFDTMISEVRFSFNHYGKFGSKKKHEICQEIGADVLIDDSIHYCKDATGIVSHVFLLDQPWNQDVFIDGITRVQNWEELHSALIAVNII